MERRIDILAHELVIHQDPTLGLGGSVWDAALTLVEYLKHYADANRFQLLDNAKVATVDRKDTTAWTSLNVCELGSGTGIAGLACYMMGSNVILTDLAKFIPLMQQNIAQNQSARSSPVTKPTIATCEYLWGSRFPETCCLPPPFDVIICSDLVYEEVTYEPLVESLRSLSNSDTIILMSYEKRKSREIKFWRLLHRYFTCKKLDSNFLGEDRRCDEIGVFLIRPRAATSDVVSGSVDDENLDRLMSSEVMEFLREYTNEEQYSQ